MARIDKYDPKVGGFRAPILADRAATSGALGAGADAPIAVGLDNQGRVVPGAGTTGIVGLLILAKAVKAGDIVDVMKLGEVVEWPGVAGAVYTALTTTGVIAQSAVIDATHTRIGHTVEASRLIVDVLPGVVS
jgi:hypothetical protein